MEEDYGHVYGMEDSEVDIDRAIDLEYRGKIKESYQASCLASDTVLRVLKQVMTRSEIHLNRLSSRLPTRLLQIKRLIILNLKSWNVLNLWCIEITTANLQVQSILGPIVCLKSNCSWIDLHCSFSNEINISDPGDENQPAEEWGTLHQDQV